MAKNKLKFLKKYGYFHYGIPAHDTIARIIIAVDGKIIRGSFDKKGKEGAIPMVSAFADENGVVLGQ